MRLITFWILEIWDVSCMITWVNFLPVCNTTKLITPSAVGVVWPLRTIIYFNLSCVAVVPTFLLASSRNNDESCNLNADSPALCKAPPAADSEITKRKRANCDFSFTEIILYNNKWPNLFPPQDPQRFLREDPAWSLLIARRGVCLKLDQFVKSFWTPHNLFPLRNLNETGVTSISASRFRL